VAPLPPTSAGRSVAAAQAVQKKKCHLRAALGAGQGVFLHGEVLAALLQRGASLNSSS
jgi:hypothetical protein